MAVHIKIPQPWDIPERQITPEALYWNRRQMLRAMGLSGLGLAGVLAGCKSNQEVEQQIQQRAQALPSCRHRAMTLLVWIDLSQKKVAAHYNNFYEFSSGKDDVWELAAFESEPWKVEITGLVQRPQTLDIDDIRRLMPLEERHYRFRCVEAWAMAVPWIGFPMRALLERVEPLAKARFVRLTTCHFQEGRKALFREYPWPYNEGRGHA